MLTRSFGIGVAMTIALATSQAASADMYKCIGPNGTVEYRDKACEGSTGTKFKASENTVGTGEGIESVRAKDAALKARQDARRGTADQEEADARAAHERAYLQARDHQDSVDRSNAIRAASARIAADQYTDEYKRRAYQDRIDRLNASREASARRAADDKAQNDRTSSSGSIETKRKPVNPRPLQPISAYPIAQPAGSPVRRGGD